MIKRFVKKIVSRPSGLSRALSKFSKGWDPLTNFLADTDTKIVGAVAKNPMLSGIASGVAGAFGGPWASAAVSASLERERGGTWGSALKSGAAAYGGAKLGQALGGSGNTTGSGTTSGTTGGTTGGAGTGTLDDFAAGGSGGGGSAAGGAVDDAVTGGGVNSGSYWGDGASAKNTWDYSRYMPEVAGSADAAFANYAEDFALADLGGGKGKLFGAGGSKGFDNTLLEGANSMYDDLYTDPSAWQGYTDAITPDYTGGSYGFNPEDWAGYSDEIAASPTDYLTSPTLRDIVGQQADSYFNKAAPYLDKGEKFMKFGRGLNDLYAKNRMAKDLREREREIDQYRMTLENRLNSYYAPGSAEERMLREAMERKDAAAGRNSQYGTRATNLAATMAERRAQYAQAMAPSLTQLMSQQTGLRSASSALRRGQLAGLWQTAGSLRDLF